jgi:TatD DNase family protein
MALIDSHAHLDFADYGDDREAVLARARAAGVVHVVLVGQWSRARGGMAAVRETLALAAVDRSYFSATAGLHPHDAAEAADADLDELRSVCAAPEVVAVGECGLDYHYDRSPRDVQRARFAAQIAIAAGLAKPVVVHTREADSDTADLLRAGLGPAGGVIHCFTGDWTAARRYLDLGLFISLSGVLTFRNAGALRDAAAQIPLDRLMLETDSPFLAPIPHRGKRNEPAHVRYTAARLAELRGLSVAEVEAATTANARRALRLPA